MKQIKRIVFILLLFSFNLYIIWGQETIPAAGGTASGTGGSGTYSVGQIVFSQISGPAGYTIQGVQQPYEISVITAVENTEDITLECSVYPNPTSGTLMLIVRPFANDNISFRLYDINGLLLQDKKIEDRETAISMNNLPPSVYLVKIIKNRKEVKVFKIIKK